MGVWIVLLQNVACSDTEVCKIVYSEICPNCVHVPGSSQPCPCDREDYATCVPRNPGNSDSHFHYAERRNFCLGIFKHAHELTGLHRSYTLI